MPSNKCFSKQCALVLVWVPLSRCHKTRLHPVLASMTFIISAPCIKAFASWEQHIQPSQFIVHRFRSWRLSFSIGKMYGSLAGQHHWHRPIWSYTEDQDKPENSVFLHYARCSIKKRKDFLHLIKLGLILYPCSSLDAWSVIYVVYAFLHFIHAPLFQVHLWCHNFRHCLVWVEKYASTDWNFNLKLSVNMSLSLWMKIHTWSRNV